MSDWLCSKAIAVASNVKETRMTPAQWQKTWQHAAKSRATIVHVHTHSHTGINTQFIVRSLVLASLPGDWWVLQLLQDIPSRQGLPELLSTVATTTTTTITTITTTTTITTKTTTTCHKNCAYAQHADREKHQRKKGVRQRKERWENRLTGQWEVEKKTARKECNK